MPNFKQTSDFKALVYNFINIFYWPNHIFMHTAIFFNHISDQWSEKFYSTNFRYYTQDFK